MSFKREPWRIDEIPSYCITLERRPDRWKRFQDQYGIQALPKLQRFVGVDGKKIDIRNDPRVSLLAKRNILLKERRSHEELDSAGGVGCALSHIALWQMMVDKDIPIMMIMEDDALVPPDFKERANQIISNSQIFQDKKRWDMWLIGADWKVTTPLEKSTGLETAYSFFMLHCYVMTKHYAERLLEEVFPILCHIDLWMSHYAAIHKTRMVATPRLQLKQYNRVSTDIQVTKNSPVTDVPTDYTKSHILISKTDHALARTAEVLCVLLLTYVIVDKFRQ